MKVCCFSVHVCCAVGLLLLGGCAANTSGVIAQQVPGAPVYTPPPGDKNEGPASVIIAADQQRVRNEIIRLMGSKGAEIESETANSIHTIHESKSFMVRMMFGTALDNYAPKVRITFTLAENGGSTEVFSTVAVISNYDNRLKSSRSLNFGKPRAELMGMLLEIKGNAEARG